MQVEAHSKWSPVGFAITILISSFLIFQVQPLISKYILPWFGGTPGVWTACMLFFQVVLFAGYAYAHLCIRYLTPRMQFAVHTGLIFAALALLPIAPAESWKPAGPEEPTWRILGLLAASVGLPYFILSSTGPLLQAWFSSTNPGTSPYRLYALSNLGSVVGLVSYPFLFEPLLAVDEQASIWSWSFGLFALCCLLCAVLMLKSEHGPAQDADNPDGADEAGPGAADRWLWFGLAACASVMLLATTNQVCQDVAVIPFLWVLPLTIYLVSFILCFEYERCYRRTLFLPAFVLSMLGLVGVMLRGTDASIVEQVFVHFTALFVCCMVCHGELVRLKPSPRHLTSFYLSSSAGGAAGGILVGLIAPQVFSRYVELHVGMLACCLVTMVALYRDATWFLYRGRPTWIWICLIAATGTLAFHLQRLAIVQSENDLSVTRNFYGVLRVFTSDPQDDEQASRQMVHGRIMHGRQFVAAGKRRRATSYYAENSGVGLALRYFSNLGPKRYGIVGLGAGTLATYGERGDVVRFYEINPEVIRLSRQYFTYLTDCPAQVDVVPGDARLSMEREESQQYDLLALDAFSSDAIPAHLLTCEAFDVYLRQIQPEGVLAVHVSNRHFNLNPVVTALAERFGLQTLTISSPGNEFRGESASHWMLVSRNTQLLDAPRIRSAATPVTSLLKVPAWTDKYINVIQILKFKPGRERFFDWLFPASS